MTDTWLQFAAIVITQGVIGVGLVLNYLGGRRDLRGSPMGNGFASRLEGKVDDLQRTMTKHLQGHDGPKGRRHR